MAASRRHRSDRFQGMRQLALRHVAATLAASALLLALGCTTSVTAPGNAASPPLTSRDVAAMSLGHLKGVLGDRAAWK